MYDRYLPYLVKNKMIDHRCRELNSMESTQVGYLKLNVFRHALGTPIADAFVTVSKLTISGYYRESGLGYFLATDSSDGDGSVPIFELPVITNENETYHVSVIANGFCPANIFDVPIYPGITTTYNMYLREVDIIGEPNFYYIFQPEIPGHDTEPGIF